MYFPLTTILHNLNPGSFSYSPLLSQVRHTPSMEAGEVILDRGQTLSARLIDHWDSTSLAYTRR